MTEVIHMARTPLASGTRITYIGMNATVMQDTGGKTLLVIADDYGKPQDWAWELDGNVCEVIEDAPPPYTVDKRAMDNIIQGFNTYIETHAEDDYTNIELLEFITNIQLLLK